LFISGIVLAFGPGALGFGVDLSRAPFFFALLSRNAFYLMILCHCPPFSLVVTLTPPFNVKAVVLAMSFF